MLLVVLATLIQFEPFRCLIEGAAVEIIKLQETAKQYVGVSDEIMLNTKTSGWSECEEYSASLWVKKIGWAGTIGWDLFFRLANTAA